MPMYEYECSCGKKFEVLFLKIVEGQEYQPCPSCAKLAGRVMSDNSFRLKGKWFKEGY